MSFTNIDKTIVNTPVKHQIFVKLCQQMTAAGIKQLGQQSKQLPGMTNQQIEELVDKSTENINVFVLGKLDNNVKQHLTPELKLLIVDTLRAQLNKYVEPFMKPETESDDDDESDAKDEAEDEAENESEDGQVEEAESAKGEAEETTPIVKPTTKPTKVPLRKKVSFVEKPESEQSNTPPNAKEQEETTPEDEEPETTVVKKPIFKYSTKAIKAGKIKFEQEPTPEPVKTTKATTKAVRGKGKVVQEQPEPMPEPVKTTKAATKSATKSTIKSITKSATKTTAKAPTKAATTKTLKASQKTSSKTSKPVRRLISEDEDKDNPDVMDEFKRIDKERKIQRQKLEKEKTPIYEIVNNPYKIIIKDDKIAKTRKIKNSEDLKLKVKIDKDRDRFLKCVADQENDRKTKEDELKRIYNEEKKAEYEKKFRERNEEIFKINYEEDTYEDLKQDRQEHYLKQQRELEKDRMRHARLLNSLFNSGLVSKDEVKSI